jgi:von Willebrand factor type A domain/Aerotolerance regulator N-terminal
VHFVGLPFGTLVAIGAVAGAAIVGLYILKLRRRPVPVPFSRIWQRILRDQEATSLFSQLKRILSLLLQLALLALLVLALGDPRGFVSTSSRNVVVLVDSSASMKAVDVATALDPKRTRMDDAKDEVKKIIRGLGGADRMLVAQMDAAVTPLSTMTSEVADLEAATSLLRATDTRADFARSLRFATDVLRGLQSPEIIVVSDGNLGEAHDAGGEVHIGQTKLSFVPIGKRGRNVAITEFSVRRYPFDRDRYEVMLELFNTSPDAEEIELDLLGDGNLVDMTKLRMAPGERLPRFYPNLSGARRTLEATIKLASGGHDDLPADDHAYALLPDQRRIRVLCVTQGNTYLEASLLLTSYLDVTYVPPAQYPVQGQKFDVTIFDDVTPPVAPGSGNVLYLNPSGDASPVKVDPAVLTNVGFDTIDRKSPFLKWTAIDDVYIGRAHKLVPRAGDKVIGASDKGALLVTGRREEGRFVALGFHPRDSDLPLRIAWPLFVLNVLGDFVAEDASYLSSFRTGEIWHIPVPTLSDEVWLTGPTAPDPRRVPVQDGRAVHLGVDAGFYSLEAGPKGAAVKSEFAANLADREESSIEPKKTITVDGRDAGPVTGFHVGVRSEWWILLLALAVLLTTIEWATYHRRITV